MGQRSRYEEYLICRQRGHVPGGTVLATIPPRQKCARCGTIYYHAPPKLIEQDPPRAARVKVEPPRKAAWM